MSDQTDREAILREIAKKKVVYTLPGMEALPVRRDISYRGGLLMDIYYPALEPGAVAPVVVFPLGYPDPLGGVRAFGPLTSWAQLIAASGMAAVLYGQESPAVDVDAVLAYLRANAAELALDTSRLGIVSSSGNVPVALSVLMNDRGIRCAALLEGYTMDADGSTAVADPARQYGFVDACAGKSVDDLPTGVPLLFIRAGRDQSPGLNHALDAVVARALARNSPLTLVNYADGAHGFEVDDDREISREIVRQVLSFLAFHLNS